MSFAGWLDVVAPQLAEPLFSPQAITRIRALAPYLPGACQVILEARLAGVSPQVDLSVQLADAAQALQMAEVALPDPLRRFLTLWAQPNGPFSAVSRLWLEFDLGHDLPALPTPTVCARLRQPVDFEWLLDSLWPAMQGRALTRAQRSCARRCWREIPGSASLLYAFSLLSRSTDAIRMEIFGLEPQTSLLRYLERVAPQHVAAIAPVTQLLEGLERIHLSVDIEEEILPRIGIEGSFSRQPGREVRWEQLFNRLTASGLAAPAKVEAVLTWPEVDSFWTAAARWSVAEVGLATHCVRGTSHVKVVCELDREPAAKVYLTLGGWMGDRRA